MRIKTYNQNDELISEEEFKIRVPKYIQEFDDSYPLVHISSKEHKLLNSKSESIEKQMLLERLRQILRFDYSLFLDSPKGDEILMSLSGVDLGSVNFGVSPVEMRNISNNKDWLIQLINYIKDIVENKSNSDNTKMWLDYIKSESKDSWSTYYKKHKFENKYESNDRDREELEDGIFACAKIYRTLIGTLRTIVYPQLKRYSKQSNRLKSILCLIPTRYSSQLGPNSFDDNKFVLKLCNTLYKTNSKRRSDVYGTLLMCDYMTQTLRGQTLNFISLTSEDYVFTIDAKGNSKIEIVSSPQENAFFKISNHPKKNICRYKESLEMMYNDYVKTKAEEIEKYTEGEFITHDIKNNHWKELHSALRKDISLKKDLIGRNQPESYYFLMILKYDDKRNNIKFNDEFIKDLLIINDRFHSVALTDIFDYIYQFNYIKAKAYPIEPKSKENNNEYTDDPFVWEFDYGKEYTLEESVERALAFISPILNSNYIEKVKGTERLCVEPDDFVDTFRKLFSEASDESVRSNLELFKEPYKEDGYPYQGFNYKLLFNIIGMLKTFHYKGTDRDVIRIFKKESKKLADKLMENRDVIKVKDGWSAFRKYISDYRKFAESKDSKKSFSIVKVETIKYIQEYYKLEPDTNFDF